MALLFADNFGWYTASQRLRWWSRQDKPENIDVGPYGPAGAAGMRFNAVEGTGIEIRELPVSGAVCIAGVRARVSAYPTVENFILTFLAPGTGHAGPFQCSLYLLANGTLRAARNAGGLRVFIGAASSYVLPLNEWVDLWATVTIHQSAGAFKVEVFDQAHGPDVQTALDLSGILDTQGQATADWDGIGIGDWSDLGVTDFAHVVVLDGSGSAPLNASLGLITVATSRPRADGTHQAWTPEPGASHHGMVRDLVADDDITRLVASAVDDIDTRAMHPTPDPSATLYAVVAAHVCRKTGVGALVPEVAPVIRHEGSDTVGTPRALSTAYQAIREVYPTAPDATAWTPAKWNAIEIGEKRTL